MKTEYEDQLPPLANEVFEDVEPEPDLDTATFFPAKDATKTRELSFSQKVERVNAMLLANTLNRPVLYRILASVEAAPLSFDELEARIPEMTEYAKATQPPSALIEWLDNVEAVTVFEVNEAGEQLTEADFEGKTEDEIDDMVFDYLVEMTDCGREAYNIFNPEERLTDILSERPQRYDTYVELLKFLKEKRTYLEIDQLLRGNPVLMDGISASARPMQPSVFIDKLAAAGAAVYDDGWTLTPEGLSFLERSLNVLDA